MTRSCQWADSEVGRLEGGRQLGVGLTRRWDRHEAQAWGPGPPSPALRRPLSGGCCAIPWVLAQHSSVLSRADAATNLKSPLRLSSSPVPRVRVRVGALGWEPEGGGGAARRPIRSCVRVRMTQ